MEAGSRRVTLGSAFYLHKAGSKVVVRSVVVGWKVQTSGCCSLSEVMGTCRSRIIPHRQNFCRISRVGPVQMHEGVLFMVVSRGVGEKQIFLRQVFPVEDNPDNVPADLMIIYSSIFQMKVA